jgi:hypothetical protein
MTEFEDSRPQEQERRRHAEATQGEASAHPAEPDHDPIQHPAPPGNPDTDEEAVAKGEENLGRVTGR